ncbi:MAG: hypothetical protein A4E53_02578 [Pelotomaculum sp. PtaB.Bin104]|nr:MAG: hypothetical protein A4E53_02578 [Pelotomaculum sp. PtaB.Bin104]
MYDILYLPIAKQDIGVHRSVYIGPAKSTKSSNGFAGLFDHSISLLREFPPLDLTAALFLDRNDL